MFKLKLDQIIGPNGNKEFNDLVKIMGCNVGAKFDLSKLQFQRIVIASDADVDGLFIRSLLCSFFFKLFPEIIEDGRLYIAEPPLYRVDDKKDPFVINKVDYNNRYVDRVMKAYKLGVKKLNEEPEWLKSDQFRTIITESASFVDDLQLLAQHYLINDRLLEIVLEELVYQNISSFDEIESFNLQVLMNHIGEEFPEMMYDVKDRIIKGIIDGKYQSIELSERLFRKSDELRRIIQEYGPSNGESYVLKDLKSGILSELSLLGILKILKRFQPAISHRFKGLGENDHEDIKTTIMDPNTRTLIRLHIGDMENDLKIFQILRGTSPMDARSRKEMMSSYRVDKTLIDT